MLNKKAFNRSGLKTLISDVLSDVSSAKNIAKKIKLEVDMDGNIHSSARSLAYKIFDAQYQCFGDLIKLDEILEEEDNKRISRGKNMDNKLVAKELLRVAKILMSTTEEGEEKQWGKGEWQEYKVEHPKTDVHPKFAPPQKQRKSAAEWTPKEAGEFFMQQIKKGHGLDRVWLQSGNTTCNFEGWGGNYSVSFDTESDGKISTTVSASGEANTKIDAVIYDTFDNMVFDDKQDLENSIEQAFDKISDVQLDEPNGPGEDDITTEDHHKWYQYGKLYFEGDTHGLKKQMDKDKFWPSVWFVSDHGNAHPVSL